MRTKWPTTMAQIAVVMCAEGAYIEIGSHVGNSAIIAAQRCESVTCIDPFVYSRVEDFWANLREYEVIPAIELVQTSSYPWPDVLEGRMWDTAFIDGEHSYYAVSQDLKNLGSRVRRTIIVDDIVEESQRHNMGAEINLDEKGTLQALQEFLAVSPEWEMTNIVDSKNSLVKIVVLGRKDYGNTRGRSRTRECIISHG